MSLKTGFLRVCADLARARGRHVLNNTKDKRYDIVYGPIGLRLFDVTVYVEIHTPFGVISDYLVDTF